MDHQNLHRLGLLSVLPGNILQLIGAFSIDCVRTWPALIMLGEPLFVLSLLEAEHTTRVIRGFICGPQTTVFEYMRYISENVDSDSRRLIHRAFYRVAHAYHWSPHFGTEEIVAKDLTQVFFERTVPEYWQTPVGKRWLDDGGQFGHMALLWLHGIKHAENLPSRVDWVHKAIDFRMWSCAFQLVAESGMAVTKDALNELLVVASDDILTMFLLHTSKEVVTQEAVYCMQDNGKYEYRLHRLQHFAADKIDKVEYERLLQAQIEDEEAWRRCRMMSPHLFYRPDYTTYRNTYHKPFYY